jgi:hypothetical protein
VAEANERYIMAAFGNAWAQALVQLAAPEEGDRVLDVACGTGPVARYTAPLVGPNITVLTSSSAAELSREDPRWHNGAFTKIVLEALSSRADASRNGLISISELTGYLTRHVPGLTNGAQHPGVEVRFDGDVFVAGL